MCNIIGILLYVYKYTYMHIDIYTNIHMEFV